MRMKRIMVDLETMSSKNNALIVSIGAVQFDMEGVTREFYIPILQDGQVEKFGRDINEDTVRWWSEQSEEARKVFTDPNAAYLSTALYEYAKWVGNDVDEHWGNGSDFDNVVLRSAYDAACMTAPWGFRTNRCFRTLKNLGVIKQGDSLPRTTHHNALDDAKVQAYDCIAYLRAIKMGQEKR